jgi:hypothetical protein
MTGPSCWSELLYNGNLVDSPGPAETVSTFAPLDYAKRAFNSLFKASKKSSVYKY